MLPWSCDTGSGLVPWMLLRDGQGLREELTGTGRNERSEVKNEGRTGIFVTVGMLLGLCLAMKPGGGTVQLTGAEDGRDRRMIRQLPKKIR